MRLMLSFASLFLSVILLQLSTGGVGPLDALSGIALNFSNGEIGILGSAHFLGFFIGCWWAPRLMGNVGHSRAFAAFTATGAIALLAHMLLVDPLAWAVMRVGSGLCVAGCYTVIKAWLQARVTNATRGRAMGLYRGADIAAALVSQMLISVLEPAAYASYNLLALLCCAAILPLTLTREAQPATPDAPRLRPLLAWAMSPLAVVGVVVSGLTTGAFRMVGPIYGQEVGLDADGIALFLTIYIAGGALAQYPLGWLADRYDRRHVLVGLSVGAISACGVTVALAGAGTVPVPLSAALFGFASFPLYSVATAHAHDFADTAARRTLGGLDVLVCGRRHRLALYCGAIDRRLWARGDVRDDFAGPCRADPVQPHTHERALHTGGSHRLCLCAAHVLSDRAADGAAARARLTPTGAPRGAALGQGHSMRKHPWPAT